MNTQYVINSFQATNSVVKKKAMIDESQVGKFMVLTIRGNGNITDVKNKAGERVLTADNSGAILRKKIFNTKCNSDIAYRNPRNTEILLQGYKYEKAGNTEAAAKAYNEYLNNIEISINLLEGSKLFNTLQDGDQVKGQVEKITTEKGSLLTLNPKTLTLIAPEVAMPRNVDLEKFLMALPDEDQPSQQEEVNVSQALEATT